MPHLALDFGEVGGLLAKEVCLAFGLATAPWSKPTKEGCITFEGGPVSTLTEESTSCGFKTTGDPTLCIRFDHSLNSVFWLFTIKDQHCTQFWFVSVVFDSDLGTSVPSLTHLKDEDVLIS